MHYYNYHNDSFHYHCSVIITLIIITIIIRIIMMMTVTIIMIKINVVKTIYLIVSAYLVDMDFNQFLNDENLIKKSYV